ncbi:hypothetical protein [Nocardioides lianchengensis]|uniref:Uncharacterized protein n=1 Tax=Nocardioides lianchengensis TaxID=1045774 RepID=A0A1G6XTF0_9ACTN|nr:hypothetical protein [Nocardioides lianchengensis]NYG13431.1 hypothetical protein [Nocardioides lianchengensis]SDD81469.1 hypothetical protein SAMN05421872_11178 [Nocardioides lianchengensis]
MRRTTLLVSLLTATALAASGLAGGGTASADPPSPAVSAAPAERGGPGVWSKLSTGTVGTIHEASLYRTADRVLHVVYPRSEPENKASLGHAAVRPSGTTALQNSILTPWSIVDATPAVVGGPDGGLRVLFGGQRSTVTGEPYNEGQMYHLTAPAAGTTWTLQTSTVGQSHNAYASYGTAATALADGTPIAAYPLNSTITWHVGTENGPDQSFEVAGCCAYDLAMVRSGGDVWLAWYGNGGSAATNGTFVRRIHPSLGPVLKAPGSSVGADSLQTGRVALAARAGGGVYAAYCSGYPTCTSVRLWKVGAGGAAVVPGSGGAGTVGLGAAPGGRLWVAWGTDPGVVRAVRTDPTATRFGAVRAVGAPAGRTRVYALGVDGGTGRGDVVVNPGDGFWHTQVLAGLTLKASPTTWRAGRKRAVRFTVTDAGNRVAGARVTMAGRACTTGTQGTCRVVLPKRTRPGRKVVRATRTEYAPATVVLKVKKAKKKRR